MDPLRKHDIEQSRRMSPDKRMRAVVETVNVGIRIQLATIRAKHPRASEEELETKLRQWLKDERTNA